MKKLFVLFFLLTSGLSAQGTQDFGLAVKVSETPAVGLSFNFERIFSLRALVSYSGSTLERQLTTTNPSLVITGSGVSLTTITDTVTREARESRFGGMFSGIFYLPSNGPLVPYLGFEFGFTNVSSVAPFVLTSVDSTIGGMPLPIPFPVPNQRVVENDASALFYTIAGNFGLEFALSPQFRAFGELSLGYRTGENIDAASGRAAKFSSFSLTNSGIGILYYF